MSLPHSDDEEILAVPLLVEQDILSVVKELHPSEKIKPTKWGKHANAPYYRKRFALWIKPIFDLLLQEEKDLQFTDRMFFYEEFPDVSHNSLYLKIYQAKLYLIDEIDPTGIYKDLCERISFTRVRGTGIRISWNKDVVNGGASETIMPKQVLDKDEATKVNYQDEIDKFLESAKEGDKVTITRIALSPEEISLVKQSVNQLDDILCKVNSSSISLLKLSAEDAIALKAP